MGSDGHRDRGPQGTVLIVEDDRRTAEDLMRFLAPEFRCVHAATDTEATALATQTPCTAALVDLHLGPTVSGFDVIARLRKIDPQMAILIMSGDTSEEALARATKLGVHDFIPKSIGADELRRAVRRSLILHRVTDRVRRLEEDLLGRESLIVAASPAMKEVAAGIERAARHTAPVLITGPVGAGKMIVAREIHRLSRAGKPFERVHCATLDTGELADSQLFGYEPGAHSMARGRFIGAIERSEDGTFLLDDVDYLPVRVQVKLLQPLEERILRRLPGSVEVRIRCRVIATTNKDLGAMAAAGTFRADLLSRLGGGQTIHVPGINERKEDLPGLVDIFARQVAAETGIRLEPIPEAFRRAVVERRWQDVRELSNAIRYAVGVCAGGVLHPDDLAGPSGRNPGAGSQGEAAGSGAGSDLVLSGSLEGILDRTRAAAVQLALARNGGDKRAAAAELQITVQWLNTILRQTETGKSGESTALR